MPTKTPTNTLAISVKIPAAVYQEVRERARQEDRTITAVLVRAIRAYTEKEPAP